MANTSKCLHCLLDFSDSNVSEEIAYKCYGCHGFVHMTCAGLSPEEVECLALKSTFLKYFCNTCNANLELIKKLRGEIDTLKRQIGEQDNCSIFDEVHP
ncbi:hypothetical protein O3M35_005654 [Rhynocoris fuscipes]|uniref:Zinc finger PHD-type domain-containing protein n=1 Tax=Rhynocoris fuscipes TaxID=488301 RepID=A0AAW1DJ06_9HEMI